MAENNVWVPLMRSAADSSIQRALLIVTSFLSTERVYSFSALSHSLILHSVNVGKGEFSLSSSPYQPNLHTAVFEISVSSLQSLIAVIFDLDVQRERQSTSYLFVCPIDKEKYTKNKTRQDKTLSNHSIKAMSQMGLLDG